MHMGAFLIALVAVGIMGFANQRGGTCTVAALEEVVLKGRFRRLIALFEASLWAGAGFVLLDAAGLLTPIPASYAAGMETIAGGVLFGLGAFVNGSCIFGSVARLGSAQEICPTLPCHLDSISVALRPYTFLAQLNLPTDHPSLPHQHGSPLRSSCLFSYVSTHMPDRCGRLLVAYGATSGHHKSQQQSSASLSWSRWQHSEVGPIPKS